MCNTDITVWSFKSESMMHHQCIAINLCCSDARLAATFNQFVSFSDQNLTSLALSTYRGIFYCTLIYPILCSNKSGQNKIQTCVR